MNAPQQTAVAPVALYARVSTEDQADNDTIDAQLHFLRRFVELHGLPVAGEYVDDGVSGTIPLGERPDGRRLLTDAEAGAFGAVLFYNVKRLGRSLKVLITAHDALDRLGIAIRSGTEPLDTGTAIGRFIFQLLGSVAELDHANIAEQTSRGRDRVAALGVWTGGPIPFGYDLDEHKRLIPSERVVAALGMTEAEVVLDVFVRLADGQTSINAEWRRLNALGVPRAQRFALSARRAKSGKPAAVRENPNGWGYSSLHQLVHNPIYAGEGVLDSRYGRVTCPAPALVDRQTWERAQAAMIANRRLSKQPAARDYPMRGLIRCANCGGSYVGATYANHRRYRCSSGTGRAKNLEGGRCSGKQIPADWIEGEVWSYCAEFIRNPGEALNEARRAMRERMATASGFDERRRAALAQLAEKESERERVLTLYRKGKISDEEAERELDAVAREAGHLRAALESLRAQEALIDAQEAYLTDALALLGRLREELDEIEATDDQARKRAVIERYVRQVTVETRRVGPRRLEADIRIFLRLKPDAIAVDTSGPTSAGQSTKVSSRGRWRVSRGPSRSAPATGLSPQPTPFI